MNVAVALMTCLRFMIVLSRRRIKVDLAIGKVIPFGVKLDVQL